MFFFFWYGLGEDLGGGKVIIFSLIHCITMVFSLESGFFLCIYFISFHFFVFFFFRKVFFVDYGTKERKGQLSLNVFNLDQKGNKQWCL
jgi:hypothetical protein